MTELLPAGPGVDFISWPHKAHTIMFPCFLGLLASLLRPFFSAPVTQHQSYAAGIPDGKIMAATMGPTSHVVAP
jgi:hypothetical protein